MPRAFERVRLKWLAYMYCLSRVPSAVVARSASLSTHDPFRVSSAVIKDDRLSRTIAKSVDILSRTACLALSMLTQNSHP